MDEATTRLETLYRDVGPGLLAYLRRCCREPQAAEDLLQETFLGAARRIERLLKDVSPRAWLYAIARNVAVTHLRRRRPTRPMPADIAATAPTAASDELEPVRRAIAELPEPLRETLELRLGADLSYAEIAEVLEIPVGTVRSRLHHALQRVRAAAVTDPE